MSEIPKPARSDRAGARPHPRMNDNETQTVRAIGSRSSAAAMGFMLFILSTLLIAPFAEMFTDGRLGVYWLSMALTPLCGFVIPAMFAMAKKILELEDRLAGLELSESADDTADQAS